MQGTRNHYFSFDGQTCGDALLLLSLPPRLGKERGPPLILDMLIPDSLPTIRFIIFIKSNAGLELKLLNSKRMLFMFHETLAFQQR